MLGGVTVQLAALEDVIASKTAAGRRKDNEALPELIELALSRRHHAEP
jgi:predicted nucleotidyltransferase